MENSQKFDFKDHLEKQAKFSSKTFGPGDRTKSVIDHIRKELDEILEDPTDLSEWIDVVILALDGAWRVGYSPDEIINQLVEKTRINEQRKWPDWRKADPDKAIEHVRE